MIQNNFTFELIESELISNCTANHALQDLCFDVFIQAEFTELEAEPEMCIFTYIHKIQCLVS